MTTDLIKNTYKSFEKNPEQLGIQSVFTPVDELAKIFDFKKEIENKTNIGILFNVEFLEYFLRDSNYITNKKFTFFYDSEIDHCMAWSIVNNNKNVELVSIEKFSNTKDVNYIKEKIMHKHFDIVFTNPPYKNLDLKLVKNLIDNNITDEIICVHPGSFLFNHNKNGKNDFIFDLKNTKTLEEVTFFWGNDVFETLLKHAHCITKWNKNHNSDVITVHDKAFTERKDVYDVDEFTYTINVNDVTVHSKVANKAAEFLHKFENCDNLSKHEIENEDTTSKTKFGFKLPSMMPGFDYKNRNYGEFFALVGYQESLTNAKKATKTTTYIKQDHVWYFNTEEERENFINYIKLKSTRFLFSLYKYGSNMNVGNPTSIIPWMDFTKHYSEEDLKKAWGIDDELWDYIDKFIPDYYEDYKEIAK